MEPTLNPAEALSDGPNAVPLAMKELPESRRVETLVEKKTSWSSVPSLVPRCWGTLRPLVLNPN